MKKNTEKTPEQIKAEMNLAADIAKKDLKNVPAAHIKTVAAWVEKHYMTAGYKRLCRVLMGK